MYAWLVCECGTDRGKEKRTTFFRQLLPLQSWHDDWFKLSIVYACTLCKPVHFSISGKELYFLRFFYWMFLIVGCVPFNRRSSVYSFSFLLRKIPMEIVVLVNEFALLGACSLIIN